MKESEISKTEHQINFSTGARSRLEKGFEIWQTETLNSATFYHYRIFRNRKEPGMFCPHYKICIGIEDCANSGKCRRDRCNEKKS